MNITVNGFRHWFMRYLRVVAKICYVHGQRFLMLQFNGVCEVPNIINAA
jgi:hypothetical protein